MANNTVTNEMNCSIMPDLSQNLATEESTWEEIMSIKSLPVNMAQKKEMKAKLLSAETFRLQGFKQFKWKRRKLWEKFKVKKKELGGKWGLWGGCLKRVRGHFGVGVVTLFSFIKWLVVVNLVLACILSAIIILPTLLMEPADEGTCFPLNETLSVECCRLEYSTSNLTNSTVPWDLALGSGLLEHTALFYGFYPRELIYQFTKYNIKLFYVTVWGVCIALTFILGMNKGWSRFRNHLIEKQNGSYKYCSMLFSGWDFGLFSERGKMGRHRAITSEVLRWLDKEDIEEEKQWGRGIGYGCAKTIVVGLMTVQQGVIYAVAIGVVAAQGAIVFFVFEASHKVEAGGMWTLLIGYLPSACAAVAHAVVPCIVKCLVPHTSHVTSAAAPRLATYSALLLSFYYIVHCSPRFDSCSSPCPPCWETLFGQHVTRLLLSEVAVLTFISIFIDLPRSLCSRRSPICEQEFHLPLHIVHILYFQVLILSASFYAPFLPLLGVVLMLFLFYLKKFCCLVNSYPAQKVYWASKSNSVYIVYLLISIIIAVIPWLYHIVDVRPSKSCGPYSFDLTILRVVLAGYLGLPQWFRSTIDTATSPVLTIPLIIILTFSLYYFYIISKANRDMVIILKKQLILEGHDKQFLLNRLSSFIRQRQNRHKSSRYPQDPPPPNSTS